MKPKHFFIICGLAVLMYLTIGGWTNTMPDIKLFTIAGYAFGINYSKFFIAKIFAVVLFFGLAMLTYKSCKNETDV